MRRQHEDVVGLTLSLGRTPSIILQRIWLRIQLGGGTISPRWLIVITLNVPSIASPSPTSANPPQKSDTYSYFAGILNIHLRSTKPVLPSIRTAANPSAKLLTCCHSDFHTSCPARSTNPHIPPTTGALTETNFPPTLTAATPSRKAPAYAYRGSMNNVPSA